MGSFCAVIGGHACEFRGLSESFLRIWRYALVRRIWIRPVGVVDLLGLSTSASLRRSICRPIAAFTHTGKCVQGVCQIGPGEGGVASPIGHFSRCVGCRAACDEQQVGLQGRVVRKCKLQVPVELVVSGSSRVGLLLDEQDSVAAGDADIGPTALLVLRLPIEAVLPVGVGNAGPVFAEE